MSEIKSQKAKEYFENRVYFSLESRTPKPIITRYAAERCIIIAETELTEHYEQQLQELRDRITNLSICDIDTPVFTHTREFRLHFDYIKKCFTQKLTEK